MKGGKQTLLLNSFEYKRLAAFEKLRESCRRLKTQLTTVITMLLFSSEFKPVYAAQGDRVITVIKNLTQDVYGDFVYLSLGFVTVVCIYHLIMIVFTAGDDRARNKHLKAIITAILAWAVINIFGFFIQKIYAQTGQSTASDVFSTGSY